ncbi:hypothetical protein KUTeg_023719 [Tegillarca granosa]|uniref:lysozyme n=1 Tax=Tegillarca granosa TaxID=220873 RepID=A0ABQ9E2G7_TEGGR|nr:hypothetical protein KUTeg_023719 [Tegillarca granosa]
MDCRWDVGSDSCGYFQIKYNYWVDCGRPGGRWKSCAKNYYCASKCVQKYMNRYINARGCKRDCQSYARLHNGGPGGCLKDSTLRYWRKITQKGCF